MNLEASIWVSELVRIAGTRLLAHAHWRGRMSDQKGGVEICRSAIRIGNIEVHRSLVLEKWAYISDGLIWEMASPGEGDSRGARGGTHEDENHEFLATSFT